MRGAERGNSLADLYGPSDLTQFICVLHTISLALWGEVGPLGLGEGELACGVVWPNSLADLYGPSDLTQFICVLHTISLALWGEVGPLGLGEGELACGVVWPLGFDAVFLNGSRWGGCVGCEAV